MRRCRMNAALSAAVLFALAVPVRAQVAAPPPVTPQPAQAPEAGAFAPIPTPLPAAQTVDFDEAVRIALERHPDAARAAQAILRAEALLQSSRSVFMPSLNGAVTTTILNEERVSNGQVTQPQTQSAFGVQASYPVLAAARWAQAEQAADQVAVARISQDETRRQIALAASDAYLAVINLHRQVTVQTRALENGRAHLSFATSRLQAGAGRRRRSGCRTARARPRSSTAGRARTG